MVGGIWGQTRNLGDRTFGPVDVTKNRLDGLGRLWCTDMGTDTMLPEQIEGQARYSDMGQARCPIYRSGPFNV